MFYSNDVLFPIQIVFIISSSDSFISLERIMKQQIWLQAHLILTNYLPSLQIGNQTKSIQFIIITVYIQYDWQVNKGWNYEIIKLISLTCHMWNLQFSSIVHQICYFKTYFECSHRFKLSYMIPHLRWAISLFWTQLVGT